MQPVLRIDDLDDSDDDPDYVPPVNESPSDGEREMKRPRTDSSEIAEHNEAKGKERATLWAEFQASVSESPPLQSHSKAKLVKIEKKYRFAGEDVVEVKEVPEDSEEAIKWPRWLQARATSDPVPSSIPQDSEPGSNVTPDPTDPQPITQPSSSAPAKLKKRPGPRKSKILDISGPKPKKLTTLDKSLMDWRSHVTSEEQIGSGLKDELEANRRGGGYLEKVEFLQRVGDRKEEALEASRATKRRRGL